MFDAPMMGSLLKALGVKLPPDTIEQIQAIVPQIPAYVQRAQFLIEDTATRLKSMGEDIAAIKQKLGMEDKKPNATE